MTDRRKTEVQLKGIGWYQAPSDYQSQGYAIGAGDSLIELITGGVVYEEGKACGTGHIFWHMTGERTVHRTDLENPYQCVTVSFAVSPGHKRPCPRHTQWSNREEFLGFTREILEAYHREGTDEQELARYLVARISWVASQSASSPRQIERHPAIDKTLAYIETHYGEGIQVETLATHANLSVPHLHTLFRKQFGQTPYQYLRNYRLQRARFRLVNSDEPIKLLSYECGFHSVENFCRVFKERFAITPGDYRQHYRYLTQVNPPPRPAP